MPKPNARPPVAADRGQFSRFVAERAHPSVWRHSATPKHVSFSLKFRFER